MKKTHWTRNIIPEKIIIDGMNPILIVFGLINKVKKNDTLSKIIEKHYGNKGLNFTFVQAAILFKNKSAFVRSNPNYMYAKKNLYLPSINEIKDLVYRNKKKVSSTKETSINQEIYFFGN